MTRQRGFSLLELMLVLVILGVLLCIALPAYQQVVVRAHRFVGKAALMEVMARQERYLLNHKRYGSNLAELGFGDEYFVGSSVNAVSAVEAVYKLELAITEGDFSGARAVPLNGQRQDSQCGILTLDRWGVRGVLGRYSEQPGRCW